MVGGATSTIEPRMLIGCGDEGSLCMLTMRMAEFHLRLSVPSLAGSVADDEHFASRNPTGLEISRFPESVLLHGEELLDTKT